MSKITKTYNVASGADHKHARDDRAIQVVEFIDFKGRERFVRFSANWNTRDFKLSFKNGDEVLWYRSGPGHEVNGQVVTWADGTIAGPQ